MELSRVYPVIKTQFESRGQIPTSSELTVPAANGFVGGARATGFTELLPVNGFVDDMVDSSHDKGWKCQWSKMTIC
jgi:hypothetical protein